MPRITRGRVRFGSFELDPRAGELHKNGQSTVLQEQQLKVLLMLIEREGDLVTREEIKRKLWPNDTIVEFDSGINSTIKKLRGCLGDSAENPQYIETIARRGYRLLVTVEWVGAEDSSPQEPSASDPPTDSAGSLDSDTEALPKAKLKIGRLTGQVVSHYRVLEVIGGGGMGLVYRAEHLKLGRAVALKFLPEEVGDDPKARDRFKREADAVYALDHPNICTVYDFDEYEGHPFIAMQLLQGKTLRDHIADGRFRLTESEGLEVAIQIASGLEAAHEKGIIHRDIKPANIFITEKNVAKILDFGVAKVMQVAEPEVAKGRGFSRADSASHGDGRGNQSPSGLIPPQDNNISLNGAPEGAPLQMPGLKPEEEDDAQRRAEARLYPKETSLTGTGMKLGTAGYMSPEQVRGEPLDERTDIFSFGLVLYEMATGERAFSGETEAILHDAIQHRDPKAVRELAPEVSASLEGVIGLCLEKEAPKRYQSATELREALVHERVQVPLVAPESGLERRKEPHPRRRFAAALIAALVVATLAGAFYRLTHPRFKLTDKDTIVVAHFQNLTGDAVMDDALDWPLVRELSQSPYLNLLYSSKIRDTLKQLNVANVPMSAFGTELTPELAREVCSRSESRAVVTASIANAGNDYDIALEAEDCRSRKTVAKVEADTNDRNQIVHTLGTAGRQLRRDLGEPEASLTRFNTPLENDTSSSVEALQAYLEGMRLRFEKGDADAIPELKRAVQLDPNLAEAHLNLAAALSGKNGIPAEESKGELTSAYNLRERLSPRERWFIEMMYYALATGELEKSKDVLEQWVNTFPADPTPHNDFSAMLIFLGQHERAAAEAQEAARLIPSIPTYSNEIFSLILLDRVEEANAVLQDGISHGFDDPGWRSFAYEIALLEHNQAAMQEQLAAAMKNPESKAWAMLQPGGMATYRGRLREARRLYAAVQKELRWPPGNPPDEVVSHMAIAYAETGSPAQAKQYVEEVVSVDRSDDMLKATVALVLARAGAVDKAKAIADSLDQSFPLGTLVQNFQLPAIRAAIALHQNQPAQAVQDLKPALSYDLANIEPLNADPHVIQSRCQRLYPAYLRGIAYLQLGDGAEAAGEFHKIIDHPGIVQDCATGPLAYLQLGRAQVVMGDEQAARKSYEEFLTLWKDADPDIPIYRQAKAEYAKLNKLPATSSQPPAGSHQLSAFSQEQP